MTLSSLAMAMTTARLLRDWRQALLFAQPRFAPERSGFQREPLSRLRAASMPRKSGFVKEGNWAKIVLSRVPPVLPSATSNRAVISVHVKPAPICAAKNSFRILGSSENIISGSNPNQRSFEKARTHRCGQY